MTNHLAWNSQQIKEEGSDVSGKASPTSINATPASGKYFL